MRADKEIDIGVIFNLPITDEEVLEILASNDGFLEIRRKDDCYLIVLKSHLDQEISLVVYCNSKECDCNSVFSTAITTRMIVNWHPRLLIHVGLAVCLADSEFRHNEVTIPKQVKKCFFRNINNLWILSEDTVFELDSSFYYKIDKTLSNSSYQSVYGYSYVADKSHTFSDKQLSPTLNTNNDVLHIVGGGILSDGSFDFNSCFSSSFHDKEDIYKSVDKQAAGFIEACAIGDHLTPWLVVSGITSRDGHKVQTSIAKKASHNACNVLRLILFTCISDDYIKEHNEEIIFQGGLLEDIEEMVRTAFFEGRREEGCALAKAISRELWKSAEYDLRISIGEMVNECEGAFSGVERYRMGALIDDLGWTIYYNYKDRRSDAIKYISEGIKIAEALEDYYYVAKGYRHLASIERSADNIELAEKYLKEAKDRAGKISNNKRKNEMIASLRLSEAKLLGKKSDDSKREAIKMALRVADEYRQLNCPDRAVKTYRFIGEMYDELHEHDTAQQYYNLGFDESMRFERLDEMEMNSAKINNPLSKYKANANTSK